MIIIPPLLFSLISEGKIDPLSVKIYRIFKMYEFNSIKNLSLGRILSDVEMNEKEFRRSFKKLEEYGFITRKKVPGKSSEYVIKGMK